MKRGRRIAIYTGKLGKNPLVAMQMQVLAICNWPYFPLVTWVYVGVDIMEVGMSTRGVEFANAWVHENINVEPYDPPPGMIEQTVQQMLAAAKEAGISREDIEDDTGDLHDFISEQFEARTDQEVERLASKDD